jgi:phosphatidylglycerol:prolipoprotein diacylglycerol transferase
MIPYLDVQPIRLGGLLTLQPFGLLVVTGCVVGYAVGRWHAGRVGLDQQVFRSFTLWVLTPAFLSAHWVALLAYYPGAIWHDPMSLLRINTSLSSFGGFLGAALGAVSYWRLYGHQTGLSLRSYGDAVAVGWTAGWFFGRLGCTLAHDHPGLPSDFWLAVQFPAGPRHDLGLYEWFYTIGLNLLVFSIRGRQLPPGALLGLVSVCYAPGRFLLDYLRAEDIRYAGLTPGQYFSLGLLLFGLWILATSRNAPAARVNRGRSGPHGTAATPTAAPSGRRIGAALVRPPDAW